MKLRSCGDRLMSLSSGSHSWGACCPGAGCCLSTERRKVAEWRELFFFWFSVLGGTLALTVPDKHTPAPGHTPRPPLPSEAWQAQSLCTQASCACQLTDPVRGWDQHQGSGVLPPFLSPPHLQGCGPNREGGFLQVSGKPSFSSRSQPLHPYSVPYSYCSAPIG